MREIEIGSKCNGCIYIDKSALNDKDQTYIIRRIGQGSWTYSLWSALAQFIKPRTETSDDEQEVFVEINKVDPQLLVVIENLGDEIMKFEVSIKE